jgi:hypothetical protein
MDLLKREVVLIGSTGQGKNLLQGVGKDLSNARAFFTSERGGKFYDSEVRTIFNKGLDEVSAAIHNTTADYQIVYFSGHGYTESISNRRMLCLPDFSISDTYLLSRCPRQLIFADACRTLGGHTIGAIPGLGDEYENFTGSPVRELFDNWIKCSPAGKIIIHSTPQGTVSLDSTNGGVFTRALIDIANSYYPLDDSYYLPVGINKLLFDVENALYEGGSHQRPCIVYRSGDLQVPFSVAKRQRRAFIPKISPSLTEMVQETPQSAPLSGLLVMGLIILGVAVLTA